MNQEDYKKLNDYLNGCFRYLEKSDFHMLEYIFSLAKMSDYYIELTNHYDLKPEELIEENLTFEDVYLLARQIIDDINPSYLDDYDNLIKNGILDFGYNGEYYDSEYVYYNQKKVGLINIVRDFTYYDVTAVVHEYMHRRNLVNNYSMHCYVLTEFISIYFPEYAKMYLENKGIKKEKLIYNDRVLSTRIKSIDFSSYSIVLLAYEKFGSIDEKTCDYLHEFYIRIKKEQFENECLNLLKRFENCENRYKNDIKYETKYNENELAKLLANIVNKNYKYIIGTVLAFYALENCDKDKMVYLNDHINDYNYANMEIEEVLKTIGIDYENIKIEELMGIMENRIIKNGNKVR